MLILVYITILFYTYSSAYVYVISRLWRVSEWWSDPSCGHPLTPSWRTRITVVVPHPLIPPCLPVDTHECLPEVRTKLPKPVDTRHSDPRQTNVHSSLHFVLDQTLPTGIRTQHTHIHCYSHVSLTSLSLMTIPTINMLHQVTNNMEYTIYKNKLLLHVRLPKRIYNIHGKENNYICTRVVWWNR